MIDTYPNLNILFVSHINIVGCYNIFYTKDGKISDLVSFLTSQTPTVLTEVYKFLLLFYYVRVLLWLDLV